MRSFLKFRFSMGAHVLHAYQPGRHITHRFFGGMYVASWRAQAAKISTSGSCCHKKTELADGASMHA
jgi:hypothetical protein